MNIRKCASMHAAIAVLRKIDPADVWVDPVNALSVLVRDRPTKPTAREIALRVAADKIVRGEDPTEFLKGFTGTDVISVVGLSNFLEPLMAAEYGAAA